MCREEVVFVIRVEETEMFEEKVWKLCFSYNQQVTATVKKDMKFKGKSINFNGFFKRLKKERKTTFKCYEP